MLFHNGEADAETQPGATTRPLRGVKGIEETRQRFRTNTDAIILHGYEKLSCVLGEANLDAAGFADFADGLLGIGDEVEKNLDELIAVADNSGELVLRLEVHDDV